MTVGPLIIKRRRPVAPKVTQAGLSCACLFGLIAASSAAPRLQARDLLAADLLQGPMHQVESEVPVAGYMGQFTIRSDFGQIEVSSAEMARVRIAELDAVERLRERTSTNAFAEALGESAANRVRAVEQTVADPIGTAKSIGRGVGRLFGRARRAVENRLAGDDNETPAAVAAPPNGDAPSSGEPSSADRVAGAAESATRWFFGYNGAVRRVAAAVGADPYTTNPLLAEQFDRLAKAAIAGGRVLGFFVPYIPAVSEAARLGSLSWSLSREDLEERNREVLLDMGVDDDTIRRFQRNEAYSPTVQTALVLALESLEDIENRSALVGTAMTATTEVGARMYVRSAHLLAAARDAGQPLQRGRGYGRALAAEVQGGGLVVAAAVDYLPLDPEVATALVSREACPCELWITGFASEEARERHREAGWILRERVRVTIPWPGSAEDIESP